MKQQTIMVFTAIFIITLSGWAQEFGLSNPLQLSGPKNYVIFGPSYYPVDIDLDADDVAIPSFSGQGSNCSPPIFL